MLVRVVRAALALGTRSLGCVLGPQMQGERTCQEHKNMKRIKKRLMEAEYKNHKLFPFLTSDQVSEKESRNGSLRIKTQGTA